jgi:hypothetical protein
MCEDERGEHANMKVYGIWNKVYETWAQDGAGLVFYTHILGVALVQLHCWYSERVACVREINEDATPGRIYLLKEKEDASDERKLMSKGETE